MKGLTLVFYLPTIDKVMSIKMGLKYSTVTGIVKTVRIPTKEVVGTLKFFDAVYLGVL